MADKLEVHRLRASARHEILGGEDIDRMKLSRVWAFGWVPVLVFAGFGMGAAGARALDAQHPLRHAGAAEPHLIESRRASGHHYAARGAKPAAAQAASHSATSRWQARLTPRGQARASP